MRQDLTLDCPAVKLQNSEALVTSRVKFLGSDSLPSSPCRARRRRGHAVTYQRFGAPQDLIANSGIQELRRHHIHAPALQESRELRRRQNAATASRSIEICGLTASFNDTAGRVLLRV